MKNSHSAECVSLKRLAAPPIVVATALLLTMLGTLLPSPAASGPLFVSHFLSFGAGLEPVSVVVGDVNHDGHPDLVTTNFYKKKVSLLLGIGDQTFGPASEISAGISAHSALVGDFDRDGNLDVATVNYDWFTFQGNTISILLGNGNGTFRARCDHGTASGARFAVAGDFDGDGALDLATANVGSAPFETGRTISILRGIGDGSFGPRIEFPLDELPNALSVGDLNGDQRQDLAVPNSRGVAILIGKGDGSFTARRHDTASGQSTVAIGNLNGDHKPDLALSSSILPGNGDGTFAAAIAHPSISGGLAIADFNRDGRPDLAGMGSSYPPRAAGSAAAAWPTTTSG